MEQLGAVIGDRLEGRLQNELSFDGRKEIDLAHNDAEANFFRGNVLRKDQQHLKTKIVMAEGAKLIAESSHPDCWIYCVTSEFDIDVMAEFSCDSCVEIPDAERFFKAISKKIRHKATFVGWSAIQYGNRRSHYSEPTAQHPAWTKDVEYSNQKEIRAIWMPKKKEISPLMINLPPSIARQCRLLKL